MKAWVLLAVASLGCTVAPRNFESVCLEASDVVQRCGASLPFIHDAPCTGLARFASECITQQVRGCAELASLMRNVERCFPDAGNDEAFPEAESLPFPAPRRLDGGTTP